MLELSPSSSPPRRAVRADCCYARSLCSSPPALTFLPFRAGKDVPSSDALAVLRFARSREEAIFQTLASAARVAPPPLGSAALAHSPARLASSFRASRAAASLASPLSASRGRV